MPKQQHDFVAGFGHSAGPAYAQASHDAMMQTLRDFAAKPEAEKRMEVQTQEIAASKQNQSRAASDQGLQELKAPLDRLLLQKKIDYYAASHQKMMKAATGEMTPAELIKEQQGLARELKPESAILMDEHDRNIKQEQYDFYTKMIEKTVPGRLAKPHERPSAKREAGLKVPDIDGTYKTAEDVKAAVASGSLDKNSGIKILREQFKFK